MKPKPKRKPRGMRTAKAEAMARIAAAAKPGEVANLASGATVSDMAAKARRLASGPQNTLGYERYLSESELSLLHSRLLEGKLSLKRIAAMSPVWTEGRYAKRRPCISTLSNIRDRLLMELRLREDEETTKSLLEELRSNVPNLSEAEIDRLGTRTFSLLTIRAGDLKGFTRLRSAMHKHEIDQAKLDLRKREIDQSARGLKLKEQEFQRRFCESFLQYARDNKAIEIAIKPGNKGDKVELLGRHIFKDLWDLDGTTASDNESNGGTAPGGDTVAAQNESLSKAKGASTRKGAR